MTGVALVAVPLGLNGPAKRRRGQNNVGEVKEGDTVGQGGKLVKLQKFSLHTDNFYNSSSYLNYSDGWYKLNNATNNKVRPYCTGTVPLKLLFWSMTVQIYVMLLLTDS